MFVFVTAAVCMFVFVAELGERLTEEVSGSSCFWFGEADPQRRPLPVRRRQVGWFQRRPVLEEIDLGSLDLRLGVTGQHWRCKVDVVSPGTLGSQANIKCTNLLWATSRGLQVAGQHRRREFEFCSLESRLESQATTLGSV